MRRVSLVQTRDGVTHRSQKEAQRHVDKQYGDALCGLAHRLCKLSKYGEFCEFIDAHLPQFTELARIKADLELDPDDDDSP